MTQQAAIKRELEELKSNEIIRTFVEKEATKKIADDINNMPGRCCTVKAAEMLIDRKDNKDIKARWMEYVSAGYVAVMMAKYKSA